jgi:hypothetical protein
MTSQPFKNVFEEQASIPNVSIAPGSLTTMLLISNQNQRRNFLNKDNGDTVKKCTNTVDTSAFPRHSTTRKPRGVLTMPKVTAGLIAEGLAICSRVNDIKDVSSIALKRMEKIAIKDSIFCQTNGKFTSELLDSFNSSSYSSITLSGMTFNTLMDASMKSSTYTMFCSALLKDVLTLQSLKLHNCQFDDACTIYLAKIITSQSNTLKELILSRNKMTDCGAETLVNAMKCSHCNVRELDLSHNHLTTHGVLLFAQNLPLFSRLKVLRLEDSEHLLPVSIYQQFAVTVERNCALQLLTLGSEIMDGTSAPTEYIGVDMSGSNDVDSLLRYWWQEPKYTAVTDHLRTLLRLNFAGLSQVIKFANDNSSHNIVMSIHYLLKSVKKEKQLDACFRILRLKPDILMSMS